ncbi:hypothetical protein AALA94_02760 [Lactococcus taiwanensis]
MEERQYKHSKKPFWGFLIRYFFKRGNKKTTLSAAFCGLFNS